MSKVLSPNIYITYKCIIVVMPTFQPGIFQFWGLVTFWLFFMLPILQTLMWYLMEARYYGVNTQSNFVYLSNFFPQTQGYFLAASMKPKVLLGSLQGILNHYYSSLSPSPSVLFTFIKWICTLFHTDFFFFLRLLHILETKAMVTVMSDQSPDNGLTEFIQGRKILCMHSNLTENWAFIIHSDFFKQKWTLVNQ